jgi:mono/diheme cytochrome c family protein
MKSRFSRALIYAALGALPFVLPAAASAQAMAKPDPAEVDKGRKLYTQNCARCHGINMVSTGAGFFDLRKFPLDEKPRFVASILNGLRAMPAWKEKFGPPELDQLWAYVANSQIK